MQRLGIICLFILGSVSHAETEDQTGVVEYIQELTGKVDALEKRLEKIEHHLNLTSSKDIKTQQIETLPKDRIKPTADRLWDDAICSLQQKNYEDASQLFSQFLRSYPNHTKRSLANYWLGEIQLLNKNYTKAQGYYALAYKAFSNEEERKGETGLKIAECYFALGKNKEGCLFLKEIMKLKESGAMISSATLKLMEKYWLHHKCTVQ